MSEQSQHLFNQVDQQIANGHAATVLVERTNGDITAAQIEGMEPGSTNAFFGDISQGAKNGLSYKPVGNEKLTDQYQEHLAQQLAGQALRGSVVALEAPASKESFDPEVANLERSIREAEAEKRRAQQEGRGQDSIYWGQVAGQYAKQLSNKRR